jgi:hypothetical protein
MPRSPAQSDFVIEREPAPVALPPQAASVELPVMIVQSPFANEVATRWVMRLALLALLLLAVLCAVGPHLPGGE